MVSPTAHLAVEMENIATITGASKEADFQAKCTAVTLRTTKACHIAFDRPANTSDFLLEPDSSLDIHNIEFTKVSAIAASEAGVLYIMARR